MTVVDRFAIHLRSPNVHVACGWSVCLTVARGATNKSACDPAVWAGGLCRLLGGGRLIAPHWRLGGSKTEQGPDHPVFRRHQAPERRFVVSDALQPRQPTHHRAQHQAFSGIERLPFALLPDRAISRLPQSARKPCAALDLSVGDLVSEANCGDDRIFRRMQWHTTPAKPCPAAVGRPVEAAEGSFRTPARQFGTTIASRLSSVAAHG